MILQFCAFRFLLKFLPLMNFISTTVRWIFDSFTPKNCKFFSLFLWSFPKFLSQIFDFAILHFPIFVKVFTLNEFYFDNHPSDFWFIYTKKLQIFFFIFWYLFKFLRPIKSNQKSNFGDIATLKNGQISLSDHGL